MGLAAHLHYDAEEEHECSVDRNFFVAIPLLGEILDLTNKDEFLPSFKAFPVGRYRVANRVIDGQGDIHLYLTPDTR